MYTQQSGLSAWLGKLLLVFSPLPRIVIALLVSIIVASVTEVMSNIAATTLFLPVLKQLVSQFSHHFATPSRNTVFFLPHAGYQSVHTPPLSDDPSSCISILCFHDPHVHTPKCNRIFIWVSKSIWYGEHVNYSNTIHMLTAVASLSLLYFSLLHYRYWQAYQWISFAS